MVKTRASRVGHVPKHCAAVLPHHAYSFTVDLCSKKALYTRNYKKAVLSQRGCALYK